LVDLGYIAIRLGTETAESLDRHLPHIVDLTRMCRVPILDLYIAQRSRFFLGTSTGIAHLGHLFRKPLAIVNCAPFLVMKDLNVRDGHELYIPKQYVWKEQQRLMTVTEIVKTGAGGFFRTEQFEAIGIELLENTPDEIESLAVEMHERLVGTWRADPTDEE